MTRCLQERLGEVFERGMKFGARSRRKPYSAVLLKRKERLHHAEGKSDSWDGRFSEGGETCSGKIAGLDEIAWNGMSGIAVVWVAWREVPVGSYWAGGEKRVTYYRSHQSLTSEGGHSRREPFATVSI